MIHGLCGVNVYIGDICMMLTYLGYGVILGLVEHCICVACMKLTTLCVGSDVMFDL